MVKTYANCTKNMAGRKVVVAEAKQLGFPYLNKFFLQRRIEESTRIIEEAAKRTKVPIIVQFSGGKDSLVMLDLVQKVTDNLVCSFMTTGIEFPEAITFAGKMAKQLSVPILYSKPSDHKGDFFQRLEQFREWPTIRKLWCQRDLKIRAQKKMLEGTYGKQVFYKAVGVRRWESSRRKYMYSLDNAIQLDNQTSSDFIVLPLVNWTNNDVANYLKEANLPTSSLYKRYGVSGCYWCPFYGRNIYRRILKEEPDLYDRFIEWEIKLNQPSVIQQTYLRDLKTEQLDGLSMVKQKRRL